MLAFTHFRGKYLYETTRQTPKETLPQNHWSTGHTDMAANGYVEDQIALRLNLNKNQLRAKFIDEIKRGKQMAAASEAQLAGMSRQELHACNTILLAFDGGAWNAPGGRNDLWPGLDGRGARSPAVAFAAWLADGGSFICTGLDGRFSTERLREFVELKAEAEKLLQKL